MSTFLIKPQSINKSDILGKVHSLHPSEYKKISIKNPNLKSIGKLVEFEGVGEQIDVDEYLKFNSNYKLVTISNMQKCIIDINKGENIAPKTYNLSSKKLKKGDILISRNASLGKITYVNKNFKGILNGGISVLRIEDCYKFFVFAFFMVDYGVDYLTVLTSGGGTQQNAKRQNLLDVKVPFPTLCNHKNPELVTKYVSLLVQNIIDKEEQIEIKSKSIDKIFLDELTNEKNSSPVYKHPTISKLKSGNRLDTIIYSKRYFRYDSLIKSYKNGYFFLELSDIVPGKTPKDYYYSNYKKSEKFYEWVTPKNIDGRRLDFKTYIHTKANTKIKKNSIVLNAIRYVGNGIYIDSDDQIYSNQNTLILNKFSIKEEQIYLYSFLTSEIGKYMQLAQRNFGIVPILYKENLSKIPIPKLKACKKGDIVNLYYNKIEPQKKATLDNYLEQEIKKKQITRYTSIE